MCLIVFSWNPDGDNSLSNNLFTLAANRDEFYARPTENANWWQMDGYKNVLAGRDLQSSGTWLGVNRSGRFAALTNYRDPSKMRDGLSSRGFLVSEFLRDTQKQNSLEYLNELAKKSSGYNDFNLLIFDGKNLLGYSSSLQKIQKFPAGIHAVSNANFDTPWPKLQKIKQNFSMLINKKNEDGDNNFNELFNMLSDKECADDKDLPNTGISPQREKALSAICIRDNDYGTRASTIVKINNKSVEFCERSWQIEFSNINGEIHHKIAKTADEQKIVFNC